MNATPLPEAGRLKENVLQEFRQGNREWPKRTLIRRWMKRQAEPRLAHASDASFSALRNGGTAPWHVLEILAGYLGVPVSQIAEATSQRAEVNTGVKWWKVGWPGLWRNIVDVAIGIELPGEAMCRDDEDARLAALSIIEYVGRHTGPKEDNTISREEALDRGEASMGVGRADYAQLVVRCRRRVPRSVTFVVVPVEGGWKRVGVSFVIPISRGAYLRFREGALNAVDIPSKDVRGPSDYLLCEAMTQAPPTEIPATPRETAQAQFYAILRQFVDLGSGGKKRSIRPNMLGFAGTPENEERLIAYSFRPVGTVMPLGNRKVFEFAQPPLSDTNFPVFAHYEIMCAMLQALRVLVGARRWLNGG
jgi:hypothetical protein